MKFFFILSCLFFISAFLRAEEEKQESLFHYGFDLTVEGTLYRHNVGTIEPLAWVSYKDFTASVWYDAGFDHWYGHGDWGFALDYSHSYKKWTVTVEIDHSLFGEPFAWHPVAIVLETIANDRGRKEKYLREHTEVSLALGWQGFLNPTVTFNKSITVFYGSYATFSIFHDFGTIAHLTASHPIDFTFQAEATYASRSFNLFYYGLRKNGWSDAEITLSLPIELNQTWSLTPYILGAVLLESRIRHIDPDNRQTLAAGITLSGSW